MANEISVPQWAPLVDIVEDDKEYLIKVELPEVRKDDAKVKVESGTLTISGERKAEKEEKGRKSHLVERYHRLFERSFSIPDDAEADNVKAKFSRVSALAETIANRFLRTMYESGDGAVDLLPECVERSAILNCPN